MVHFKINIFLLFLSLQFSFASASLETKHSRSVYSFSPVWDSSVILAGSLATAIPYLCSSKLISKRCPCDPNEINGLDRNAVGNDSALGRLSSDVLVAASLTVPVLIDAWDLGWSQELLEDAVLFSEVVAVNSALVTLVKFTVQRPIPLAYSGQLAGEDEGYRSFYSGHVSTAVSALTAATMTLNFRYHKGYLPWVGTALIGTAVAIGRVTGGDHFLTDVAVGALVGAGVGIVIPWLHAKQTGLEKISFAPIGAQGIQLVFSRAL